MSSAKTTSTLPEFIVDYLSRVRTFYNQKWKGPNWAGRAYRKQLARYYRRLVPSDASVLEVGCGAGHLLAQLPNQNVVGVDLSEVQLVRASRLVPNGSFVCSSGEQLDLGRKFDVIILSDTLNQSADVQRLLARLVFHAHIRTRLIINFHNNVWKPLFTLAESLHLRSRQFQSNWLSGSDVVNLLGLAGWHVVKKSCCILAPLPLLGLDRFINRYVAPWLPTLGLSLLFVARLKPRTAKAKPVVSVIIPARNEAGNIEAAVQRTPQLGAGTEIIFCEGNSSDATWSEIQRVKNAYANLDIVAMQQSGRGKGNAVREAFEKASGDMLIILDADLTVPPEELSKFYDVLVSGVGEFANGVRLVYPMEDRAMQFLNMVANHAFGVAFTWLLGQPVKDTLCGTKALWKRDYQNIAANRAFFGDFDPFGDFDLLFGANHLNLHITDVPIRYRERTYGTTNINRWRHGVLLLQMLCFAARRIKFV